MADKKGYDALYAQDKGHYDQATHPEEAPVMVGAFKVLVPEGMFQQPEARFIMWLDFQLDQLRADIMSARRRQL
jgi:hypothetical protein